MFQLLKLSMAWGLVLSGINAAFRLANRRKLLVIMYHGITRHAYDPPLWTQLPVKIFREQIEYLKRHYLFVTLDDVVSAVRGARALPPNAVLITFDDGLRNNYDVVFPILSEFGIPAAIFLTIDFIGTEKLLWFDELYFLLKQGYENNLEASLLPPEVHDDFTNGRIWDSYCSTVEMLKRCGEKNRISFLNKLRGLISLDTSSLHEDFGSLDWSQVRDMHDSGLVSYGTHTASHRILSELTQAEWEKEIARPRRILEEFLGTPVSSFCFPNGKPGIDFNDDHLRFIRASGYDCAFTTGNMLFRPNIDDPMSIGRKPAGNDATSSRPLFRINTSGCLELIRGRKSRRQSQTLNVVAHGTEQ